MGTPNATPDRGALFDRFPERSGSVHGGNLFDEGFSLQNIEQANGRLHDLFGVPVANNAHGQRFDEFGWRAMPDLYGVHYDQGFASPTAFDNGEHTSWFDVFRPGTGVRYRAEGQELTGVVMSVNQDHAVVETNGKSREVGLTQFLALRSPSLQGASPAHPASDAQAPSAHSTNAHGGARTAGPGYGTPAQATPQGRPTEARKGLPGGLMDAIDRLKTLAGDLDVTKAVAKEHVDFDAMVKKLMDENPDWSEERAKKVAAAIGRKKYGAKGMAEKAAAAHKTRTPLSGRTAAWSRFGGNDILKTIDSTETAVRSESDASAQSAEGGSWCPDCRTTRKTAAHCPSCGTKLVAKTTRLGDLSKSFGAPADPLPGGQTLTSAPVDREPDTGSARSEPSGPEVPERAHPTSDHHESPGDSRTAFCPHCGEALRLNDERTEEGQAAHKCLAGALDVLKALAA